MEKYNRNKCFKSVSEILKEEKTFNKMENFIKEYEVIEKFYEIFPEFKNEVIPKKIENGNLVIKVDNSVWRAELKIHSKAIKEKINKKLNNEIVKTIKFAW